LAAFCERAYSLLEPTAWPEIRVLNGACDLAGIYAGDLIGRKLACEIGPAQCRQMTRAERHDDGMRIAERDAAQEPAWLRPYLIVSAGTSPIRNSPLAGVRISRPWPHIHWRAWLNRSSMRTRNN